jgi:acetate kinase
VGELVDDAQLPRPLSTVAAGRRQWHTGPMFVLVVNCGSSSIKAAVLDSETGRRLSRERVERLAPGAHESALAEVLPELLAALPEGARVEGVGHRVVHGGERFAAPTRIDDEVLAEIERLAALAPLHNPANAAGIRAARKLLPDVPHVAVFDTAFHASLPRRARTYALPRELAEEGVRRYGFHGTSHQYVARLAATWLESDVLDLRIITCHLGNGCSVAAVESGRSVETSMGMTPLEGLVMGTRSGDVDAGLLLHLMRAKRLGVDEVDELLNKRSGLAGLSGVGNDVRDIEERAAAGDESCRLALQVFSHRVRKYIGAYAAVMGGVDAIVFTGGIGENSALMRHRIAQRLDFLGARVDEDRNRDARPDYERPVAELSAHRSRVALLAVKTDEQRAIAEHVAHLVREHDRTSQPRVIPIAVSARHIHLTQAAVEALFGPGHTLTPRNPLSQPGQFACEETLSVVGPKRQLDGVRVLGPVRKANQVEISRTDEFFLGLDAPVRRSGDTSHSPGVTLVGPAGKLTIPEGVICAWRHVHMTPDDAEAFGVKNGDLVEVRVGGGDRELTFGDVMIRVHPNSALEMHIDTDEANAAEITPGAQGMLVSADRQATLLRRRFTFDETGV